MLSFGSTDLAPGQVRAALTPLTLRSLTGKQVPGQALKVTSEVTPIRRPGRGLARSGDLIVVIRTGVSQACSSSMRFWGMERGQAPGNLPSRAPTPPSSSPWPHVRLSPAGPERASSGEPRNLYF